MYQTLEARFWDKVEKTDGCWLWKGFKNYGGYGVIHAYKGKNFLAHRVSYELHKGKIPKEKYIDHLCRNRACVNPNHIELVTFKENILRGESFSAINAKKTHCPQGHEYSKENTIIHHAHGGKGRYCQKCQRAKYWEYSKKYPI